MISQTQDDFGSDAQRALLRRGRALYELTRDDPRMSYYGRAVGLAASDENSLDMLCALIALQGSGSIVRLSDAELPVLRDAVERRGLAATHYTRWLGQQDARDTARKVLCDIPMPDDLSLHRIGPDTPHEILAQLAHVALACGVLPPAGAVLRGQSRPGLGIVALDPAGRGVACAGAAGILHPDHPDGRRQCWWGMLATLPERRGARLSLLLGAMALLDMQARYGFTEAFTGIEPGNNASEAVCARLGLVPEGTHVLNVVDPAQLPGGRMTK